MRVLVLVGVVLFACDRGANPADDCVPSAEAFVKTMRLKQPADPAKVKAVIVKHCVDDHWMPEVRRCLAASTTGDKRRTCEARQLTSEQVEKLDDSLAPFVASQNAEQIAKLEAFKIKMCACKDAKCAEDVSEEMTKWSQEYVEYQPKLSEDEKKKWAEIGEQIGTCMMVATAADRAHSPQLTFAEQITKLDSFKERMCKCKDKLCAQNVSDEMMQWSQQPGVTQETPTPMTEEQQKRAADIGEQMGKCMQKAMAHEPARDRGTRPASEFQIELPKRGVRPQQ